MGKIGGLASTARTPVFIVHTNKGQNLLIYLWWEVLMVSQGKTQIIFKVGDFPEHKRKYPSLAGVAAEE